MDAASDSDAQGLAGMGGAVTGCQERRRASRARGSEVLPARQREEDEDTGAVGPAGQRHKMARTRVWLGLV